MSFEKEHFEALQAELAEHNKLSDTSGNKSSIEQNPYFSEDYKGYTGNKNDPSCHCKLEKFIPLIDVSQLTKHPLSSTWGSETDIIIDDIEYDYRDISSPVIDYSTKPFETYAVVFPRISNTNSEIDTETENTDNQNETDSEETPEENPNPVIGIPNPLPSYVPNATDTVDPNENTPVSFFENVRNRLGEFYEDHLRWAASHAFFLLLGLGIGGYGMHRATQEQTQYMNQNPTPVVSTYVPPTSPVQVQIPATATPRPAPTPIPTIATKDKEFLHLTLDTDNVSKTSAHPINLKMAIMDTSIQMLAYRTSTFDNGKPIDLKPMVRCNIHIDGRDTFLGEASPDSNPDQVIISKSEKEIGGETFPELDIKMDSNSSALIRLIPSDLAKPVQHYKVLCETEDKQGHLRVIKYEN